MICVFTEFSPVRRQEQRRSLAVVTLTLSEQRPEGNTPVTDSVHAAHLLGQCWEQPPKLFKIS